MSRTKPSTWRIVLAALRVALSRHDDPHYECGDRDCDGLNEPGVGHVCVCSCSRCDLSIRRDYQVCTCQHCDAAACGLHEGLPAMTEEDA